MRNNEAEAEPSIAGFSGKASDKPAPWGMIPSGAGTSQRCLRSWLVVRLGLAHDLLGREVNPTGREGIADEEIVAFLGVVALAVLEVRIFRGRQRQLHRLRHHIAFERGDGGLDRNRDLGRAGSAGRALQAFRTMRGAQLAEAVLGLASDRYERMTRIH